MNYAGLKSVRIGDVKHRSLKRDGGKINLSANEKVDRAQLNFTDALSKDNRFFDRVVRWRKIAECQCKNTFSLLKPREEVIHIGKKNNKSRKIAAKMN